MESFEAVSAETDDETVVMSVTNGVHFATDVKRSSLHLLVPDNRPLEHGRNENCFILSTTHGHVAHTQRCKFS